MKTVSIILGSRKRLRVPAHFPSGVRGKFAVHKNHPGKSHWVITHAPSGRGLPFIPDEITSLRHGLAVAKRVFDLYLSRLGHIPDDPFAHRKQVTQGDIRAAL